MEQILDENSEFALELKQAQEALHSFAAATPDKSETTVRLEKLLAGLKAKLIGARQTTGEPAKLTAFQLSPDEKLLSRHKYKIERGHSDDPAVGVFRARDVNIERTVAMKLVGEKPETRDQAIAELIAEARMIGQLEHPNIQSIHELSVDENGRAFYTAKLMRGTSLAKILDDLAAKKNIAIVRYNLKRLLAIFDLICDALAFAHSESIAHGQLSAHTIHVGDFGEVLVTGWERAKKIRQENVGTYEADIRSDIAGLADLLLHILTLIPPIPGEKKQKVKLASTWKVPKGLWKLTLRILRDRGASAYPRVTQLQTEVEDFRDDLGPRDGRASAFDLVKKSLQRWQ